MQMNSLGSLNGYLHEQLERLNNTDTVGEELKEEMNRARSIASVSKMVVENAALVLQVKKFQDDLTSGDTKTPDMLEG